MKGTLYQIKFDVLPSIQDLIDGAEAYIKEDMPTIVMIQQLRMYKAYLSEQCEDMEDEE